MADKPKYGSQYSDADWGCDYFEIETDTPIGKIKVCHVIVNDIKIISEALAKKVLDTSWMTNLDVGSKRAYDRTVQETASTLVEIFESTTTHSDVGSEFGEVMVSIGSTKALEKIFNHVILPIAELWKPQIKQNEGFDFHTVCSDKFINFGEAKYSGSENPHGNAINQSKGFIDDEKHLRDYVHLRELASDTAVENLNNDSFGIVASFSINASDPLVVLKNAIKSAQDKLSSDSIKAVYLVGVSK
ncbi:hypothetical protein [Pseudoalteromonas sp. R3]|uniref:hypothetical protein n=1 Tax=Pseudoalteromonas sp. R3 TaxID=1709477 RepID=UPI0006B64071|nr:hypothetical protein [Pseudoalteromonas sp. R3]